MLKRGSKNAVFVRGDYKPAKLYKGTQLVAGWSPVTKAAPCAWDGTYNDFLDVTLTGKGEQNGTPTPDAPVPLAASECALTSKNAGGTKSSTLTKSNALRKIPGSDVEDTYVVNGDGTVTITRNVKVLTFYGDEPWAWSSNVYLDADGTQVGTSCYISSNKIGELPGNTARWCNQYSCFPTAAPSGTPKYLPDTGFGIYLYSSDGSFAIFILPKAEIANLTAWRNHLAEQYAAGTPIEFWYRAATPETETISAADFATGTPTALKLRQVPGTDYKDTAKYLGSGKWEITRNVAEVKLADVSFSRTTDNGHYVLYAEVMHGLANATVSPNNNALKCGSNIAKGVTREQSWANAGPDNSICIGASSSSPGINTIRVRANQFESAAAFKTYLAALEDPAVIWYARATPAIEYVQLGELKTYPGYTALEVTGELLPEVTAGAKAADVTEPGVVQTGTELYIKSGVLVSQNEDRLTIGG